MRPEVDPLMPAKRTQMFTEDGVFHRHFLDADVMNRKDEVVASDLGHVPPEGRVLVAAVAALEIAWRDDRHEERRLAERVVDGLRPIGPERDRRDILPKRDLGTMLQRDRLADDHTELTERAVALFVVVARVTPESNRLEHLPASWYR